MENKDKVKLLYDKGLSVGQISLELNMQPANVCTYLNKVYPDRVKGKKALRIKRKYTINESYFDNIDTEDKAYFLGLLYADGCVSKTSNTVQIALKEEDKEILETFKKYININKPLGFIQGKVIGGFKDLKKDYIRKNQFILCINSLKIKESLLFLGLTSNKSLTIAFPENISSHLMSHFIRGIFDGDGCITSSPKNKWVSSIAGNESFCLSLQSYLKKQNIKTTIEKHSTNNVFYVKIFGRLNCIDFYNFLYKDSTVFLQRKYNKFQNCITSTKTVRNGNTWKKES